MTAAAGVIRATVHNRVDNQVRGASLANHRHRRSDRSRAVLPAVACRGATSRSAPATPSSLRRRAAAHRAGLGRRPVRGVRSEEGKSDLKALRAPSLRIRHRRTGQLVTDTIPGCRSEHPKRRRLRQHHRRRIRFSTPTNPGAPAAPARWGGNREPIPGPPGEPTLRICRKRANTPAHTEFGCPATR